MTEQTWEARDDMPGYHPPDPRAEQTSSEGDDGGLRLTEAERELIHALHATPINRTSVGCPLCHDHHRVAERILADRLAAVEAFAEAKNADLRARLRAVEALVWEWTDWRTWEGAAGMALRAALANPAPDDDDYDPKTAPSFLRVSHISFEEEDLPTLTPLDRDAEVWTDPPPTADYQAAYDWTQGDTSD